MKKYVTFILIILILTGCENNKILKCELSLEGAKIEQISKFTNDKLKKASIKYTYNFDQLQLSQQEILKSTDFCNGNKPVLGYSIENCSQKIDDTNMTVEGDIILDTYNLSSKKYKETKEYNEQLGYTCK